MRDCKPAELIMIGVREKECRKSSAEILYEFPHSGYIFRMTKEKHDTIIQP